MAPKKPQSYLADAQKLEKSGDVPGAIKVYKSFISKHRSHPSAVTARLRCAQLSVMIGQYQDAIKLIKNSGGLGENNLRLMYTLAQACAFSGKLQEAHDALSKTLNIDQDYPPAIARLATIMQYEGQHDQALKLIDQAYDRGIDYWEIDQTLGELASKAGRIDEAVEKIERRLTDTSIKGQARQSLEYIFSNLLEQQGQYTQAWDAVTRANAQKTTSGIGGFTLNPNTKISKNTENHKKRLEKLIEIFSIETLKSFEPDDSGPESRPQILMISGMPRSGTTLLEQILSAHPQAESAGEASFLINIAHDIKFFPDPTERILNRLTKIKRSKLGKQLVENLQSLTNSDQYIVDKNPANDEHIGLLAAIAPGATMILTRRDPRDIALSCFFRNFAVGHGWTSNFDSIIEMIQLRFQLHEHWLNVIPKAAPWLKLTVGDYEHIVQNPETETRRLVEFAGLPWDDACLNFSKRKRLIPTLMPHQAAQGIYKGSVAKWTRYADCMGDSLDKLNQICERFGYPV